jgi:hypothetical protein
MMVRMLGLALSEQDRRSLSLTLLSNPSLTLWLAPPGALPLGLESTDPTRSGYVGFDIGNDRG